MTIYTTGTKPVDPVAVSTVTSEIATALKAGQRASGFDGLDVALGTLSALRSFVLWNVGAEGYKQTLEQLADVLINGEHE